MRNPHRGYTQTLHTMPNGGKNKMSSFMDCPHCGTEFIVAEELMGTNMRCPDCFQWINQFGGIANTEFVLSESSSYSSYTNDVYDELGWESGYDY
jgi:predicted Zn finger-like uncharacterized protein